MAPWSRSRLKKKPETGAAFFFKRAAPAPLFFKRLRSSFFFQAAPAPVGFLSGSGFGTVQYSTVKKLNPKCEEGPIFNFRSKFVLRSTRAFSKFIHHVYAMINLIVSSLTRSRRVIVGRGAASEAGAAKFKSRPNFIDLKPNHYYVMKRHKGPLLLFLLTLLMTLFPTRYI